MNFDGILFFPVTPFDSADRVDDDLLRQHVATTLEHNPGGVFPACGTGEFHALSADEAAHVVRVATETVAGAVPVIAGTGGPLGNAVALAKSAADAGADALLVLPPYLVGSPQAGLVAYIEAVAAASDLPVIVYHRANAQYSVASMRRLAANPKVVGFKDGTGDVGVAQQIVRAVAEEGRDDFAFFNGLLTAELTQGAYRGIGIPLYSSAAFAMIPEVANAYYRAYADGDEARRAALLDGFYSPLVNLRDETPGFGVSLIKAGLRLGGLPVGSVRAPLVDPTAEQEARLGEILAAGRALL
ncbi:5-dehydro-4-deoxyglucarate dehydratase [Microbacterium sp. C7(2022)]|uniref:5-dehydro-4-deoxyglucarate dehydratase n=1 Tax=Microbacterium sp. C7(2022) TaxID=2992759 RepID=UPI00237A3C01|nr:5-dehydro-4-deoxyglucarate dehydratase [Microbacterium sp. C7(2022)]MDE0546636.1 5-dehydro-4-deoxyglucarate dehydratase [Microbacterium sp. C7(2022)]